jgi:hypothetical protein
MVIVVKEDGVNSAPGETPKQLPHLLQSEGDGLDYSSVRRENPAQLTHQPSMGSILQNILSVKSNS